MPLLLSVVIALYNTENEIQTCLESIFRNEGDFFEVIIVDDCSTDNSLAIAQQFPCRFFATDNNSGPAKARNIGVAQAKSDIILFLDSDTRVKEDSLRLFREAFEKHPTISAVIALPECQSLRKGRASDYNALRNNYSLSSSAVLSDYFTTQMGAIRKTSFLQAGGFNEKFTSADIEDMELGLRLPPDSILIHKDIVIGHHFPPFLSILKKYFRRAMLLTELLKENTKLCKTHANNAGMFSVWMALLSLLFLLAAIYQKEFMALLVVFALAFIFTNMQLLIFSVKKKGLTYLFEALFFEYVFSLAIGLGGISYRLRMLLPR